MLRCVFCNAKLEVLDKIFRKDQCPNCDADLHCCMQCRFYEPGRQNDCTEVRAENVADKDRANFCDYYECGSKGMVEDSSDLAKKKLDDIFK